jgi:uncharacterized SAM-binding protein YcdF (DUF218 family)
MTEVLWYVCSLGGFVVLLVMALIWRALRPQSRAPLTAVVALVAAYGIASLDAVPASVAPLLTRGYRPFTAADVPPGRVAIVTLGAGAQFVRDWGGRTFSVPNRDAMARVAETARVARLVPEATIIESGGIANRGPGARPDSEVMRDLLVGLGIAPSRIVLESDSYDTHDEAVAVAPILRSLRIDRVILVTSDIHMRRSLGTFRAAGIEAVPAIARGASANLHWYNALLPGDIGLGHSAAIIHELAGIVVYRLRGWYR